MGSGPRSQSLSPVHTRCWTSCLHSRDKEQNRFRLWNPGVLVVSLLPTGGVTLGRCFSLPVCCGSPAHNWWILLVPTCRVTVLLQQDHALRAPGTRCATLQAPNKLANVIISTTGWKEKHGGQYVIKDQSQGNWRAKEVSEFGLCNAAFPQPEMDTGSLPWHVSMGADYITLVPLHLILGSLHPIIDIPR